MVLGGQAGHQTMLASVGEMLSPSLLWGNGYSLDNAIRPLGIIRALRRTVSEVTNGK